MQDAFRIFLAHQSTIVTVELENNVESSQIRFPSFTASQLFGCLDATVAFIFFFDPTEMLVEWESPPICCCWKIIAQIPFNNQRTLASQMDGLQRQ